MRQMRARSGECGPPEPVRSALRALGIFDYDAELDMAVKQGDALVVSETDNHKCGRCWRYLPEVTEDGELCARCEEVLDA